MAELKDILETLIFVHRGVLKTRTMEGVLNDSYTVEEIRTALDELKEDYARREGVIELLEVAGGFEFGTREDTAEWVRKLDHFEHHRRLSRPALETLAIIAYRQPVTRPEIEGIRGVNVDRIIRNLLVKKLIMILGRKDVPGKPIVYGTTGEFLHHFGLRGLSDLPSLKEFMEQELPEESAEEAEILPLEEEVPEAERQVSEDQAGEEQGDT